MSSSIKFERLETILGFKPTRFGFDAFFFTHWAIYNVNKTKTWRCHKLWKKFACLPHKSFSVCDKSCHEFFKINFSRDIVQIEASKMINCQKNAKMQLCTESGLIQNEVSCLTYKL